MVTVTMEQKIAVVYSALGVIGGFISHYSSSMGALFSYVLPLAFFAAATAPLMRFMKGKARSKLLFSAVMTYVLLWATVWILLFNMFPI